MTRSEASLADVVVRQPYDSMQPPDAVVALRSLPRRWTALLAEPPAGEEETDWEELVSRPAGPDGRSAIDHAARVGDSLGTAVGHVRAMRTSEGPTMRSSTHGSGAAGGDRRLGSVLDALAANARSLADELDGAPADTWSRRGELDGRSIDVLGLARAAVQVALEELRQAEATLRSARDPAD